MNFKYSNEVLRWLVWAGIAAAILSAAAGALRWQPLRVLRFSRSAAHASI
jgi:hypothetical protein